MAAPQTLSAVQVYNFSKKALSTLMQFVFSGTFTGFTFQVLGSMDGTNYVPLACVRKDLNAVVAGGSTIATTNATPFGIDVPSHGYVSVQISVVALASNMVLATSEDNSFVGLPVPAVGLANPSTVLTALGVVQSSTPTAAQLMGGFVSQQGVTVCRLVRPCLSRTL
jgi:hypothetical protein